MLYVVGTRCHFSSYEQVDVWAFAGLPKTHTFPGRVTSRFREILWPSRSWHDFGHLSFFSYMGCGYQKFRIYSQKLSSWAKLRRQEIRNLFTRDKESEIRSGWSGWWDDVSWDDRFHSTAGKLHSGGWTPVCHLSPKINQFQMTTEDKHLCVFNLNC